MTIDDVIFNMYVLADPTYDGSSSFYTLPIEGLEEYRKSMIALSDLILKATPENTDFSKWTKEQQDKYWAAFNAAGEKFVQEIIDYCKSNGLDPKNYYNNDVAMGMAEWGFGEINDKGVLTAPSGATFDLAAGKFPTAADYWKEIVKKYGYDVSDNGINHETAGTSISELISKELGNDADAFSAGVNVGEAVASIKGIKKTGDYSATIHCTKFDATSIYQFALYVAPLHYYGDKSLYNYDQNQFGFKKGDLSTVKSKTSKPMGAGSYKFVSYENGVITYEANEGYYDGKPKIKYVLFKESQEGDKLAGVASGDFDVANPAFSASVAESIKKYNSNGNITGNVITTNTSDFLGYGYIGITAENVKVGTQRDSKESKDLRKAFATLFAVYR
ncbi:MAG TPA: ABC transporter substrate-binding protein, partial [Oscillospiraceae bacterium]|nr:ABC transporter substrate-binding protein [Oscillospiraceae bacterium]